MSMGIRGCKRYKFILGGMTDDKNGERLGSLEGKEEGGEEGGEEEGGEEERRRRGEESGEDGGERRRKEKAWRWNGVEQAPLFGGHRAVRRRADYYCIAPTNHLQASSRESESDIVLAQRLHSIHASKYFV